MHPRQARTTHLRVRWHVLAVTTIRAADNEVGVIVFPGLSGVISSLSSMNYHNKPMRNALTFSLWSWETHWPARGHTVRVVAPAPCSGGLETGCADPPQFTEDDAHLQQLILEKESKEVKIWEGHLYIAAPSKSNPWLILSRILHFVKLLVHIPNGTIQCFSSHLNRQQTKLEGAAGPQCLRNSTHQFFFSELHFCVPWT